MNYKTVINQEPELYITYIDVFERLKNVPDYNRERAEARFILIKKFEALQKKERQRLGKAYRADKHKIIFCKSYNMSFPTFRNWLRDYKKRGIEGLVTTYGNRRRDTSFWRESRGKFIKCIININTKHPLDCLLDLRDIIAQNPLIDPTAAQDAVRKLNSEIKILQHKSTISLGRSLTEDEINILSKLKSGRHKRKSNRAIHILMLNEGKPVSEILQVTGGSFYGLRHHVRKFKKVGLEFIETRIEKEKREKVFKERFTRVIDILHQSPSLYGINRTSWTQPAIIAAYKKLYGERLTSHVVSAIIKESGYKWRHAKQVLTSHDIKYKEKIGKVISTLQNLKENEAFFFIDEAGPWVVKKYGGRSLTPPGALRTVPEQQIDKGKVNFIAALEVVSNQVTYHFTKGKTAAVLTALLIELRKKYSGYLKIFLTWDDLVMHRSKVVKNWIKYNNKKAQEWGTPLLTVVPLPSCAQFLNLIEGVISGLKRAVIYNSDYPSKEKMEEAIARHFDERNNFFKENPKRAGNKIWDAQHFKVEDLPGGLYKKM